MRLVQAVLDAGVDSVSLADTVGYADPAMVMRLLDKVLRIAGPRLTTAHFHDTRGLGMANCYAALQMGITRLDACIGGIGGCPHAPGASGNVATEDLACMLASIGIETGLAFDRLIALRGRIARWLDGEALYGSLWRAGLPKTMTTTTTTTTRSLQHEWTPPATRRRYHAGTRVAVHAHGDGPHLRAGAPDLGAEVIKIEPVDGDRTRQLLGAGSGFFPMFNRNKKSIGIDLHQPEGAEAARQLCATADVVVENFKPGTLEKYGLDYAALSTTNPRPDLREPQGLPSGPVRASDRPRRGREDDWRARLITGRPGDPLRAGTSINDIMGGLFGAIGVLGALLKRGVTGRGMEVKSGLYENNVLLMGQHMLQYAMTGHHPQPMPARENPWRVRRLHRQGRRADLSRGGQRCAMAGLLRRPRLSRPEIRSGAGHQQSTGSPATATARHAARAPCRAKRDGPVRCHGKSRPSICPIRKPADLLEDEHLLATGGLVDITLSDGDKAGQQVKTALLPIALDGSRLGVRLDPPRLGEHSRELLALAGFSEKRIADLRERAVVN